MPVTANRPELCYRISERPSLAWLFPLFLILLHFNMACAAPADGPAHIVVLESDSGGPYADFTRQFRQTLQNSGSPIYKRISVTAWKPENESQLNELSADDLLVAVGTRATAAALHCHTHAGILGVLVPRPAVDQLVRQQDNPPHRFTAIYLDQPLSRYLALARIVVPNGNKIGVVLGPVTVAETDELNLAARHMHTGLLLSSMPAENANPLTALQSIIRGSDVLLALPDPMVYNRYTLSPLLLTTFRYRIPVVGFSAAFVNAGAVAGVYSDPEQIGQQAAEMILQNELPAGGQYPRYFRVSFNTAVAHALDMSLPEPDQAELMLKHQDDGS